MQLKKNTYIMGKHPIVDAIKTGTNFDKIFLQQGTRGEFEIELRHLSKEYNIPIKIVPKERLNKLTPGNHQGVIGLISLIPFYKLNDLLPGIYERSETPLILILDGITDIRNIGAIARTAECSGVHTIVISKKGTAQINAEAIKSSAGALTKIPICREQSLNSALDTLEWNGITLFASNLGAKKMVFDIDFTQPTAIVMGSEGKGINREILKRIENQFIIPQKGTTDSFNVSVATGMILYEVMRQRI